MDKHYITCEYTILRRSAKRRRDAMLIKASNEAYAPHVREMAKQQADEWSAFLILLDRSEARLLK